MLNTWAFEEKWIEQQTARNGAGREDGKWSKMSMDNEPSGSRRDHLGLSYKRKGQKVCNGNADN